MTTDLGGSRARFTAVASRSGKVVAGGIVAGPSGEDVVAARFHSSGTPDLGFGVGGRVVTDLGDPTDTAAGIVLFPPPGGYNASPDAAVLLAGSNAADMVVVYHGPVGEPTGSDSRLFRSGHLTVDLSGPEPASGRAVAVQPDGKAVIAGSGDVGVVVARVTSQGRLDPSFGRNGVARAFFGRSEVSAVAVQPDGRILVAAVVWAAGTGVLRLLPDGTIDQSFGHHGFARPDVGSPVGPRALAVLPDGRMLFAGAGGYPSSGPYGNVARLNY